MKECYFIIRDFFFHKILRKNIKDVYTAQEQNQKDDQFTLTPIEIDKTDIKAYQPVIDIAAKLPDKNVKNIAITGPFGSGKSSVLLTLKRDYPQYEYLNISLARLDGFKENLEEEDEEEEKPTGEEGSPTNQTKHGKDKSTQNHQVKIEESNNSKHDDSVLNRIIEYSILQQLIYKEKVNDIPQSRFKRIKHISKCRSFVVAIGIVGFVIACCILFEPKFLKVDSFTSVLNASKTWKFIWDLICGLYVVCTTIYALKWLIINTYNNKLNKLNIKDGEIDIKASTSIFNKHLDEIIYFFEVTKYDVVIIEDLDRFGNHTIFLKLRELNYLLNSSKSIERKLGKIVFIYAIRDDVFNDTSRTKFFDYITTVIPYINTSNSCDILLTSLKKHGIHNISEEVCIDLGFYIDDMRILKNIVNEYIQYRKKLTDKLKQENLLAMILYKNYRPNDFTLLHNQDGLVFNVFKNKVDFHNKVVQNEHIKIKTLQEELKQIKNFYSTQKEKELRTLYVMKCIEKIGALQYFIDKQNSTYQPNQIIEDSNLFKKLENDELRYQNAGYNRVLGFSFKELEKEVDKNFNYRQRLGMTPERIKEINEEIEKLQLEILEYKALPLSQILSKYPAADFLNDIDGDRLIAYLIIKGYIDENYYDYISYFFEGTLTPSDKEFIWDIRIGQRKDFTYKIYKTEATIKQIPENAFLEGTMLNIDLVDYLVSINDSLRLMLIIQSIKSKKEFSFLKAYYENAENTPDFFSNLLTKWDSYFEEAIKQAKQEVADLNFEILLKYLPQSKFKIYNTDEFRNYIANRFDFIVSKINNIGIKNICAITENLNIKYQKLTTTDIEAPVELVKYITDGNYHEISNENLVAILTVLNSALAEDYNSGSLSAIYKSGNEHLIEYINSDIDNFIQNIIQQSSINEDEDCLIEITENDDVTVEVKEKYFARQTNKITSITSVGEEYWDTLINSNIIYPSWQNIEEYLSINTENELSTILIDFISKNSKELGNQRTNNIIKNKTVNMLFTELMGTNILPFECYKQISNSFYIWPVSYDLSLLHKERVRYLIEMRKIDFQENYKQIVDHFPDLAPDFILQNKTKYLTNPFKYLLNAVDANTLLNSNQFNLREKLIIIETIEPFFFVGNTTLANTICSYLNQSSKLDFDTDYILALMQESTNQNQKLELFVKKCRETPYNKAFTKEGLVLLGGDYKLIAQQRNHYRSFKATKENRILADYLLKNDFISSHVELDGEIKIRARFIRQ